MANLTLCTLDRGIEGQEATRFYRRYVDDFAIVARVDEVRTVDLQEIIPKYIPFVKASDKSFKLDNVALGRADSDLQIQKEKCKAYHISGIAGRSFLENIRKDFGQLVSEARAFLDPSILMEDGLPSLVHVGPVGRPLTVLRDIDRLRLEHYQLSIRHRSLERASVLLDQESATQLVKRALGETIQFLRDTDDWVGNLDIAFRMLRIGVRTGDWNDVHKLLEHMDNLWRNTHRLRTTAGRFFHRGREIRRGRAVVWMRNYLHARRVESISASVLPFNVADVPAVFQGGVANGTGTATWRALVRRGRSLAAADLRTYDREDDGFEPGRGVRRWRTADFGNENEDLGRRLRQITRFTQMCEDAGDQSWNMSAASLFLCTRPPSYFDVARRFLYRLETHVPEGIFEELLELVNAIRGTRYRDPVGERTDAHTVSIPSTLFRREGAQGDPQLMLGNLGVSEECYEGAATRRNGSIYGRPLLTLNRLADLNEVLSIAAGRARRYTVGDSLLVLPELSLPRMWFRAVATHVTRFGQFGLVAGLEYLHDNGNPWVLNQAYAVIPGPYLSAAVWPWRKHYAARDEARELNKRGVSFRPVSAGEMQRRVVVDSPYGLLSVVICSELIEARRVADLLRRVEVVVVPAWNRDTASYDHLIKSVGLQLFAVVGIANNGKYADCRAWAPRMVRWQRDLCRLIEREVGGVIAVPVPLASLRDWRERGQHGDDDEEWRALPPDWGLRP